MTSVMRSAPRRSLYDGVRDCILDRDDGLWQLDFAAFSELTGTPLQARQVRFESGKASYTDLTSHWDSYASSEAYLAVRTVQARHNIGLPAGVEIQCSPATIAHIQNAISDIRSIELAAWIILSAAEQALPAIWPHLHLEGALVLRVDCTDALYADTPAQAQQIIDRCRRVAYGQRKSSDTVGYHTSVYYGETSELHRGVAYHKGPEHAKKVAAAEAELRRSPTSVMAKRRLDCLKNRDGRPAGPSRGPLAEKGGHRPPDPTRLHPRGQSLGWPPPIADRIGADLQRRTQHR
ncbi:phage/plasmid replication protein, II/X family [Aeromonas dhakensis]|uniref:phage/plasmid replication protein, II/X family n=1 Tax=Aeromonas dhakensis TaxID=196024 RepID=UPI003BA08401